MLIYLIDDDSEEAELLTDASQRISDSIKVQAFSDGKEALQSLKNAGSLPQLIFLDLNMPMISGKDVLKELRMIPSAVNIPVIIYSTTISPADMEETAPFNVKAWLPKPENFSMLCEQLKMQLEGLGG